MRRHKIRIAVILCLICASLIVFSPLFRVQSVQISGIQMLSEAVILESAALAKPFNLLFFNTQAAAKQLSKNPFIENISFKKLFPNRLSVVVRERQACGYVQYMDSYLLIDQEARVLQVSDVVEKTLPIIKGLHFSEFRLGTILDADNQDALYIIALFNQLFKKYEMDGVVSKIDLSDVNDIHLYIHNIDVALGTVKDADQKIRTTTEIILNQIPNAKQARGILSVREIEKQYIFKSSTDLF